MNCRRAIVCSGELQAYLASIAITSSELGNCREHLREIGEPQKTQKVTKSLGTLVERLRQNCGLIVFVLFVLFVATELVNCNLVVKPELGRVEQSPD
jgi:hypothetical protein